MQPSGRKSFPLNLIIKKYRHQDVSQQSTRDDRYLLVEHIRSGLNQVSRLL